MDNIRRAYIYLVSLISLQVVAWALIWFLRDLLPPGGSTSIEDTALQIALIVIGLPVYLVHWLWAQRLAKRDAEEHESVLRTIYLYAAMSIAVAAVAFNAVDLLDQLQRMAFGTVRQSRNSPVGLTIYHLAPMVVMALVWVYHRRVLTADGPDAALSAGGATVRRLYLYAFSAAGLAVMTLAAIELFDRLLRLVAGRPAGAAGLAQELASLVVGAALWLIFWFSAQRALGGPGTAERQSVIRKLYLYITVFVSVLAVVAAATAILAAGLRSLLSIYSWSDSWDLSQALSILIPMAMVWAYHGYVLRRDAGHAQERHDQAWVRRLYHYLVASVGLGAVLIGLGGVLSALIRYPTATSAGSPDGFVGFAATLIAGLPVWLLPWRHLQRAAAVPGPAGDGERRSIIRRIYLYFYLFAATMTVLGCGVYIVSRLISQLLGARGGGSLLADLAQAIAYGLIATAVWLYHGSIVRADGRRASDALSRRLAALKVAIVAGGETSLGRALVDELGRALPGLNLQPIDLTPAGITADAPTAAPYVAEAAEGRGAGPAPTDAHCLLANSDVIIGPWTITGTAGSGGAMDATIAQAVSSSSARKLLIPVQAPGWDWLGVEETDLKDIARQAVRAIRQIAEGEHLTQTKRLSAGAIFGIIIGALLMLIGFLLPLIFLLEGGMI